MKIFNESSISFSKKMESFLKEIIENEVGLRCKRTRFLYNNHSYPIDVVIITSKQILGQFDPLTFQIGLNQALMYQAKEHALKNILRHELAHYLCFLEFNNDDSPHGKNFNLICSRYNWNEIVSKASLNIDIANEYEGDLESEKLINKIKALLRLAESSNPHEAELATLKANQLLLKHNIKYLTTCETINIFADTVMTGKRRSAKLTSIYEILKNFLVNPVFIYGSGQVSIEVSGKKENIELAKYVCSFLDVELDRLWKAQENLKGLKAKNSFYMGIAKGYNQKISGVKDLFSKEDKNSLVKVEDQLQTQVKLIYKRLSFAKSGGSINSNAFQNGVKTGKSLTINKAINNNKKPQLLKWRK